jgi:hypothetical protein
LITRSTDPSLGTWTRKKGGRATAAAAAAASRGAIAARWHQAAAIATNVGGLRHVAAGGVAAAYASGAPAGGATVLTKGGGRGQESKSDNSDVAPDRLKQYHLQHFSNGLGISSFLRGRPSKGEPQTKTTNKSLIALTFTVPHDCESCKQISQKSVCIAYVVLDSVLSLLQRISSGASTYMYHPYIVVDQEG